MLQEIHIARAALVVSILLSCSCGGQDTREVKLSDAIATLGYTVIRPPSQLMPPGSIVTVSTQAPFQAKVVCSQSGAIGDTAPAESATESAEWSRKAQTSFHVSAAIPSKLNADLGADHIRDISLSLSNTKVFELSDDAVIQAAMDGNTSLACAAAIKARSGAGDPLTMIRSVLQADVVYTLQYATELSADVKLAILKAAAPELLAKYDLHGGNTIKGTALFFGIVDDQVLLQELQENAGKDERSALGATRDEAKRLLGDEVVVHY